MRETYSRVVIDDEIPYRAPDADVNLGRGGRERSQYPVLPGGPSVSMVSGTRKTREHPFVWTKRVLGSSRFTAGAGLIQVELAVADARNERGANHQREQVALLAGERGSTSIIFHPATALTARSSRLW